MIIVDVANPESCLDCRLRRCGNCIPVGEDVSKYLTTEHIITKSKPDFCPIKGEFDVNNPPTYCPLCGEAVY